MAVSLGVLVLAAVGLSLTHHAPRSPLAPARAIGIAVKDPVTAKLLRGVRYDHVSATPVDSEIERVSFFAGPRIAAEAAVRSDGSVSQAVSFTERGVPYGDWLAYQPALLVVLSALFVLMAGVTPLRRLRNLDVVAALSLVVPVVLLQHRYLAASVIAAAPALLYLAVRLSWIVLAPAPSAGPKQCTPLADRLTARLSAAQRVRLLRLVLGALALSLVMVTVSSPDPVDVISAVMEGATKLVHGVLPYGHMPGDVMHGDTYPLLSYALYTPLAVLAPVSSSWDNLDAALALTALVALAGAAALFRSVAGRRLAAGRSPQAESAGLRAALVWLSFPPVMVTVSTGTTDVVLAVMLLFAVLLWRRPAASAGLLAAAGWFKLAPAALLPVWLAPLRGRRLVAALGALAAVSAAMLILLVGEGGTGGPAAMVRAVGYQFSRGSPQSLWAVLGVQWLQPIAQAATLALVAAFAMRLHSQPALAAQRDRMAAAAAAVLIVAQLVGDYWAFLYLVWMVPLLALTLFGAPSPQPVGDPVVSRPAPLGALTPIPAGD